MQRPHVVIAFVTFRRYTDDFVSADVSSIPAYVILQLRGALWDGVVPRVRTATILNSVMLMG
jgi:hypothetical protein